MQTPRRKGEGERGGRGGRGGTSSCRPNSPNTLLVVILEKQIMPLGATHLYLTYVNVLYLHSRVLTTVDFRLRRGEESGSPRGTKDPALSFSPDLQPQPVLALYKASLDIEFASDATICPCFLQSLRRCRGQRTLESPFPKKSFPL